MRFTIAGALVLGACATGPSVSKTAVYQVQPGMTRGEVVELLGEPASRSFKDNAEALQYCRTGGIGSDYNYFAVVWLQDGVVKAMTNENRMQIFTSCHDGLPPIDWGQMPADISIEVR